MNNDHRSTNVIVCFITNAILSTTKLVAGAIKITVRLED